MGKRRAKPGQQAAKGHTPPSLRQARPKPHEPHDIEALWDHEASVVAGVALLILRRLTRRGSASVISNSKPDGWAITSPR